jgi:WD domain, G-beta repeat/PDZ domain
MSDDNTVRLWDAASGKEIARFDGHQNRIRSAVFSSDGSRLLTASLDNTARLWDAFATAQDLIDRSKINAQRCLTSQERERFHLSSSVPHWCYSMKKPPFDTALPPPLWYEQPVIAVRNLVTSWNMPAAPGFLGIYLGDLTQERGRVLGLDKLEGALVERLDPGGPGEVAGIKQDDVVLELDGAAVADRESFSASIRERAPGTIVRVTLWRARSRQVLPVTIGQGQPAQQ